jgi:hypothetical protein
MWQKGFVGGSIIINQVQLQFDEPNVEPRQWRNILDKLMPLCPDKGLLHEYDRLFASDYFLKIMMRDHGTMVIANRGMQQHHNRGVLIRSLEDNDSEHEYADYLKSFSIRYKLENMSTLMFFISG